MKRHAPVLVALTALVMLPASILALASPASALGSAVTLYVDGTNGTVTTGCTSAGAGACQTIGEGVAAAESYANDDVTVEVASGSYHEQVSIDVPAGDTLAVAGAGAASTTLDDGGTGSDVTVVAGTATVSGLEITGGSAENGGGVMVDAGAVVTLSDDDITYDAATGSPDPSTTDVADSGGGGVYNAGTVTLTGDTLSNDSASGGTVNASYNYTNGGGGLYNSGTATLTGDTVSSDTASDVSNNAIGGGVASTGYVTISASTVTGDSVTNVYGGGGGVGINDSPVANGGTVGSAVLSGDTISDNTADQGGGNASGGGVLVYGYQQNGGDASAATLTDDTITGNQAVGDGGGVWQFGNATLTDDTISANIAPIGGGVTNGGSTTLSDDTLFGNTATAGGGGGFSNWQGTATFTDDTITGNTAPAGTGGGVNGVGAGGQGGATTSIANSLLADNAGGNCYTSPYSSSGGNQIDDNGYNVADDDTCFAAGYGTVTGTETSITSTDAAIFAPSGTMPALAANGSSGPETEAISTESSAFEVVPASSCTVPPGETGTAVLDERGEPRPGFPGKNCDAGAFELQAPLGTLSAVSWAVGDTAVGAGSVTYSWVFTAATSASLTSISMSVPPGTTGGSLPVDQCFGLDCSGATATVADATVTVDIPAQSANPSVPIFVQVSGFTNTTSAGSYTSTVTTEGQGSLVDVGTSGAVTFGSASGPGGTEAPEYVSFSNSAPDISVTPLEGGGPATATCGPGYSAPTASPPEPGYEPATGPPPCPVVLGIATDADGGYTLGALLTSGSGSALADQGGSQLPNAPPATGSCGALQADTFGATATLIAVNGAALQGGWADAGGYCGYGGSSGTTIVVSPGPTGSGADVVSLQDAASIDLSQPAGIYSGTITYSVTPIY